MQYRKNKNQPVRSYTLAQITAGVAFTIAFLSALGQVIVLFLPDTVSKWFSVAALSLAVIGVIVGLLASRQANGEQKEQMERERQAREEALRKESQAREMALQKESLVREQALRNESQAREVALQKESSARVEGLRDEKWARRILVWGVSAGLTLGVMAYMAAVIKVSAQMGKSYAERMMKEIWESKK